MYCAICGAPFDDCDLRRCWCSDQCKSVVYAIKSGKPTAPCGACGNVFVQISGAGGKSHSDYCSVKCRSAMGQVVTKYTQHLNCLVCQKPFPVKGGRPKFCGDECRKRHAQRVDRAKNNRDAISVTVLESQRGDETMADWFARLDLDELYVVFRASLVLEYADGRRAEFDAALKVLQERLCKPTLERLKAERKVRLAV